MLYAQFYKMSTGYIEGTIPPQFGKPRLIEASGDRALIRLDNRYSSKSNGELAAKECKKRGFIAWSIFKGATFFNAKRVSGPWYVNKVEV
jgi:hypothetical protein